MILEKLKTILWPIPSSWRDAGLFLLQRTMIGYVVNKAYSNTEEGRALRAKTQEALNLQRGHFNSYGLDLGYRYRGEGVGVIPDSGDCEFYNTDSTLWYMGQGTGQAIYRELPESIYTYYPAAAPGALLPHVHLSTHPNLTEIGDHAVNAERWEGNTNLTLNNLNLDPNLDNKHNPILRIHSFSPEI